MHRELFFVVVTVGVRGWFMCIIYVAISVVWCVLCFRSLDSPFSLGVFTRWSRRGEYHCVLPDTSPMNPSSPHSQMAIKRRFCSSFNTFFSFFFSPPHGNSYIVVEETCMGFMIIGMTGLAHALFVRAVVSGPRAL